MITASYLTEGITIDLLKNWAFFCHSVRRKHIIYVERDHICNGIRKLVIFDWWCDLNMSASTRQRTSLPLSPLACLVADNWYLVLLLIWLHCHYWRQNLNWIVLDNDPSFLQSWFIVDSTLFHNWLFLQHRHCYWNELNQHWTDSVNNATIIFSRANYRWI